MSASASQPDTLTLAPGDTLDGYTIAEQIGVGGTSAVWKATHTETGNTVAIKQLLFTGAASDDIVAQRFRKEAKLLTELSRVHPRVVRVHEFIDDQRGAFIVMEYVPGRSLEALLGESGDPIDPLRALKITYAVANVLVAVHGRGVVHRDIKPSNLLLPDGGGIKLCDLGLAGLIAEQEALPVGSVRYMAPELFANEPATGAADIYALGMVAYEMFAGRAAFNEAFKTVLRDQRNQAMRWMKWHTNMRVSAPPLRELNPKIPPRLSDLVARMMDKDLDRRVSSAQELAEAIGRHFNKHQPTGATPPPRPRKAPPAAGDAAERTAAVPRKRRWPMYVALGVLLAGSAVGGYFILDKQARETAALEQRETQVAGLIEAGQSRYQSGDFEAAVASFEEAQKAGPVDDDQAARAQAGALLAGAQVAMAEGDLDAARQKLDDLDEMRRPDIYERDTIFAVLDEVDRRSALRDDLAGIEELIDEGRFGEAAARIDAYRGVTLRDSEAAALSELSARIAAGRTQAQADRTLAEARGHAKAGRLDEAIGVLRAAGAASSPALREQLKRLERRSRVEALQARGQEAEDAEQWAEAIEAYERLQSLAPGDAYEAALGRLRARRATAEGKRLLEQGDQAGAEAAFVRALGYHEDAEARGYLARLEAQADQASLIAAGDRAYGDEDYAAAVRHYSAALDAGAGEDVRQKLTRARVRQEVARGDQAMAAGDLGRARSAYQSALSLDPQAPGAQTGIDRIDTQRRYESHLSRGDALRAQGRFPDAKRAYRRAIDVKDTAEARQRLDETEYEQLLAQGKAYLELEQWSAARASLRNAAGIRPTDEVRSLLEQVANRQPEDPQ